MSLRRALSALTLWAAVTSAATPSPGPSDAEPLWRAPASLLELDLEHHTRVPVKVGPRDLSATRWTAVPIQAGETWNLHSTDPEAIELALLAGDETNGAMRRVVGRRLSVSDLAYQAEPGPPALLLVRALGAVKVSAELRLLEERSPGFRWELWEDAAKAWALQPAGAAPAAPSTGGERLNDTLTFLRDALEAAPGDGTERGPGAALLTATALLLDLPLREPIFPFFSRREVTVEPRPPAILTPHGEAFRLDEGKALAFEVDGPGLLRVDAFAFAAVPRRYRGPFDLLLEADDQALAATFEAVTLLTPLEGFVFSTQRRLLWPIPPGHHRLSLRSRGAGAALRVVSHRRLGHATDLITREEDLGHLLSLASAASPGSVRGRLICAEALWLGGDRAAARAAFAQFDLATLSGAAKALVQSRRLALTPLTVPLPEPAPGEDDEVAIARVAAQLHRGLATVPPASVLRRVPVLAAVALRGAPGQRAKSLEVLGDAVKASPLDEPLRERLQREWWAGARWATIPLSLEPGAWRAAVLAPGVELSNCAEARERGSPAYVEPPGPELTFTVPPEVAPTGSLHRYHLLVRTSGPALGQLDLELDGQRTQMPLALSAQRLPFALSAGEHPARLIATGAHLFVPCSIAPVALAGDALVEHEYAALGEGGSASAPVFDPGTVGAVAVELRARPSEVEHSVRVEVEGAAPMVLTLRSTAADPRVVGAALGPAVQVVLPVAATASRITITRQDSSGDPVLVRLLVRRSLGAPRLFVPRAAQPRASPEQLEALRELTRALQETTSVQERAVARLRRAELLLALDQVTLGRTEVERALPFLAVGDAEFARAMLAASAEPPLVPAAGRRSLVLAAGAGLAVSAAERACLDAALPQGTSSKVRRCPGAAAAYFAGLLADQEGDQAAAASDLLRAFELTRSPALARDAAGRLAASAPERAVEALALATLSEQSGDSDAARIAARVRGASRFRPVRAVVQGPAVKVDAQLIQPPSVRAALANVRWSPGTFLEMHPGKGAEFALQIDRPLEVELEADCDLTGSVAGEAAPCLFTTELDAVAVGPPAEVPLASSRVVAKVRLLPGSHRFHLALTPGGEERTGFVRVVTNRAVLPDSPTRADGHFILPIRPPPEHRFAATARQPVTLTVQGPTLLRVEALFEPGERRLLEVSLTGPDGRVEKRTLAVCDGSAEPLRASAPFDCGGISLVPIAVPGAFHVALSPAGSARAAISLSLRELTPAATAPASNVEPPLAREPVEAAAQPPPPVLGLVTPPVEDGWKLPGTLRLEQIAYLGGDNAVDPRVGDRFGESSLTYRQRLSSLPIWVAASGSIREHLRGAPLFGAELLGFARLPITNIRLYLDVKATTERVGTTQEFAARLNAYVERSFEVAPRLYLLPRLGYATSAQSMSALPPLRLGDVLATPEVDPGVYNGFDQRHPRRAYAQLLVWWVPFINTITYLRLRPTLAPNVVSFDVLDARAGFDVAFRTTEVIAYYDYQHLLPGQTRARPADTHRLSLEIQHTLWINGDHRLGFRIAGRLDPVNQSSSVLFGMFWEASAGRGLDDYSTPEVNVPDQIAQGRGVAQKEESLR